MHIRKLHDITKFYITQPVAAAGGSLHSSNFQFVAVAKSFIGLYNSHYYKLFSFILHRVFYAEVEGPAAFSEGKKLTRLFGKWGK